MTVLIVTDPSTDGHLSPVLVELGKRGLDVQVFDPGAFPETATVTVDSSSSGSSAVIRWAEQEIDLATAGSIWYRRPGKFVLPEELLPNEDEWLRRECAAFVDGMFANTDALWVSDPHKIRRAELKTLQLRVARKLGFRVPDYIVTNDPDRARSFLTDHPAGVIVKGLRLPILLLDDRAGMIYTHLVTAEDAEQLDSVRYGPTFLQAFVPKARDIRVTVIGDEIFAAGIASMSVPEARIDFRVAEIMDLPHEPVDLPPAIAAACLGIVRELGLQFGAIDLLETPDGDYVFLENNPNGQWYWVEALTGQPMAQAMAELLERGERERGHLPDSRKVFVPKEREPRVMPIGEQTIPIRARSAITVNSDGNSNLEGTIATAAWLEKKRGNILLHVGDLEDADSATPQKGCITKKTRRK
jgi:glutathione synthase/RimK-type ligase-like ATP-grasp enzyme